MGMLRSSLRMRLFILILIPLIVVSSLAVIWRFNEAKQLAAEVFDRNLVILNLAISRDVTLSEGDSLSETTSNLLKQASGGDVYYHVYGPDGSFVTGYSSPPVGALEDDLPENTPAVFTATHLGVAVRVVKLAEPTIVDGIAGQSVVTVWQKLDQRQSFARDLALRAGALAGLLVLTVAALVLFGIGLGLRPLIELERAIQKRSSDDLSPIERKVPQETKGIVRRLNTLFGQVTETNKARDRFISNAAHQLRNPIAGIHSMAQAIVSAADPKETKRRALELVNETRRTGRLTDQLLSLEQLSGRSPRFQVLNIVQLVTEIGERNAAQILNKSIDFTVDTPNVELFVRGDPTMLSEAIQNLIDNAVAHGGETMTFISLKAEQRRGILEITVENDGEESPTALSEILFDRFTQSEQSHGAGLGLAIALEIARLNEGIVRFETAPNTTFVFTLPLATG
jgi:two-component system sensor histidine kinase TctE